MVPRWNALFHLFIIICLLPQFVRPGAESLTAESFPRLLAKRKIALVNFYADWCRFSQMLAPIFDQAADIIHEEFEDAMIAKVNCEQEILIASQNAISKYPTLKVFRNGQVQKKEYRGQRSVDAFTQFIRNQMKSSINEFHSEEDFKPDEKRNNMIAYLESRNSENFKSFESVAEQLREDCDFWVVFGDAYASKRTSGDTIVFRQKKTTGEADLPFTGQISNVDVFKAWSSDKCVPLVRELTFENGEELTEEGLPFLLLFHKPNDTASYDLYKKIIESELMDQRSSALFLDADGTKFSHPLHHLQKTEADLPMIAIDSFRHMYLFPKFEDIKIPGKLRQFVLDLHSGKLHREFHNGPDPVLNIENQLPGDDQAKVGQAQAGDNSVGTGGQQQGGLGDSQGNPDASEDGSAGSGRQRTGPPETIFNKLMPSENRYTLLNYRDEL